MKKRFKHLVCVLKQTLQEFNQDKGPTMAAAHAYFTVFALPPLLILLSLVLSLFLDSALIQGQIRNQASLIGGNAAVNAVQLIFENIKQQENQGLMAGLISLVILLISATGLFTQLQDSLDTIWGVGAQTECWSSVYAVQAADRLCLDSWPGLAGGDEPVRGYGTGADAEFYRRPTRAESIHRAV